MNSKLCVPCDRFWMQNSLYRYQYQHHSISTVCCHPYFWYRSMEYPITYLYINYQSRSPQKNETLPQQLQGNFPDFPDFRFRGQWHRIGHDGGAFLVLSNGGKAQLLREGFDQTVHSLGILGTHRKWWWQRWWGSSVDCSARQWYLWEMNGNVNYGGLDQCWMMKMGILLLEDNKNRRFSCPETKCEPKPWESKLIPSRGKWEKDLLHMANMSNKGSMASFWAWIFWYGILDFLDGFWHVIPFLLTCLATFQNTPNAACPSPRHHIWKNLWSRGSLHRSYVDRTRLLAET